MDFHALVPAGGAGWRLWPVSTAARPKFLLSLDATTDGVGSRGVDLGADMTAGAPASRGVIGDVGGASVSEVTLNMGSLGASRRYSLAQDTARRLAPLAASLTWVTGAAHAPTLQAQVEALGLAIPGRFLVEPEARDSLVAIGLGVAVAEKTYGIAVMGSFAADHHLGNAPAPVRASCAAKAGVEAGRLATTGITPTEAATGHRYTEIGDKAPGNPGWHLVKRFHKKPGATTTRAYLETGCYLWNAGMLAFRIDMFFEVLEREAPGTPAAPRALAAAGKTLESEVQLALWRQVPHAPIDTVLTESLAHCGAIAVAPTPADIDWSDIGDWAAIYDLYAGTAADNTGDSAGGIRQRTDIKPARDSETPAGRNSENAENSGYPLVNLTPETPATAVATPGALVCVSGLAGIAMVGIPGAVVVEENGRPLATTQEHAQDVKAAGLAAGQWPERDAVD